MPAAPEQVPAPQPAVAEVVLSQKLVPAVSKPVLFPIKLPMVATLDLVGFAAEKELVMVPEFDPTKPPT